TSFVPRAPLQKMQVEYKVGGPPGAGCWGSVRRSGGNVARRMGPGPGAGGRRGRRGRRGTAGAPLTKPLTASTFPSLSAKRNVRLTAAQEIAAARANLFRPRGDPAGGRVPAFLCR